MPAKSKSQQRLMGWVHSCQKYGKCGSDKIEKIASSIKPKDAEDFAKTKHEGLPERKEEKKDKKKGGFEEWLQKRNAVSEMTNYVSQSVSGTAEEIIKFLKDGLAKKKIPSTATCSCSISYNENDKVKNV